MIEAQYRTERYYNAIKEYRQKLRDIWGEYDRKMARYEDAKGSDYYNKQKADADSTAAEQIEKTRREYRRIFNEVLEGINASLKYSIQPPQGAEMALLDFLGKREHLTQAEIELAGQNIDNLQGRAMLDEIAKKNELKGGFCELPPSAAVEMVKALEDNAQGILAVTVPGQRSAVFDELKEGNNNAVRDTLFYYDVDPADKAEAIKRFGGGCDNIVELEKYTNANPFDF